MSLSLLMLLFYQVDTAGNKENVAPIDNDAYKRQSLHMSSQGQVSLLSGKKTTILIVHI